MGTVSNPLSEVALDGIKTFLPNNPPNIYLILSTTDWRSFNMLAIK